MLQKHLHEAQRLKENTGDHYLDDANIPDNEDEPDFDDGPDDPFDARTGVTTAG